MNMEFENELILSIDKVCRTCLTQTNNLKSVFDASATNDSVNSLRNMLEVCTSVQVSQGDPLPSLICLSCKDRLSDAFKFRQLALKSEETLRNYLSLQSSLECIDDIKIEITDNYVQQPEIFVRNDLLDRNETIEITSKDADNEIEVKYEMERAISEYEPANDDSLQVRYESEKSASDYELLNDDSDSDPDFDVLKQKQIKKSSKSTTKTVKLRKQKKRNEKLKERNAAKQMGRKVKMERYDPEVVKEALLASKKKYHEKRECRLCGFISSNARGLSLHIAHIHKEMKNRWCPLCYIEVNDLVEHKKSHDKERLHKCTFCEKSFRAQGHLTEHLRSHLGERPFKCEVCGKGFLSARHKRVHFRIHTGERPYECEICEKRFTQKSGLQGHMLCHTGNKPYKCQVCNERWSKFTLLAQHLIKTGHASEIDPDLLKTAEAAVLKEQDNMKVKLENAEVKEEDEEIKDDSNSESGEDDKNKPKYIATVVKDPVSKTLCTVCGKTFTTANKWRLHMRVHTGETPYRCEYCDKRFSTRGQQVVHVRTHTGEKPHVCHICGKGFAQSSVLNTHMKLHTGRPEQCSVCLQRFCRPAELRLHMRKHTGEKPYLCTECGQAFIQSSHLTEHLKTHSDERPFACPHCDRAFKQNSSLRSHIQIHTGEKPYMCSQCPYACRQSYSLTQHMRQHGGDVSRPHVCMACNKRFTSIALLNAHSRSAHNAVY